MKQREVKFRAWDKENNCMYEWGVLSKRNNFMEALEMNKENLWELMQYTGLKDRYGKEIWEGDIVEYQVMFLGTDRKAVIWHRDRWTLEGYESYFPFSEVNVAFKVIGNIYSNPKPLKQK